LKKAVKGSLLAGIVCIAGVLLYLGLRPGKTLFIPPSGQPMPHHVEYKMEASLAGLPARALTYEIRDANVTKQDVIALAEKLGIKGDVTYDPKSGTYNLKDGEKWLEVWKSGMWSYYDHRVWNNIDLQKDIPSDEEAVQKAREALQRLGINTEGFNVRVVAGTTGSFETERVVDKNIYFMRVINGIPVYGVSRIIVTVGHKGEIEAICKYYHEIEPGRTVKLKSIEEAFQEVKKNKASSSIHPDAKTAVITKVTLGYWEDPGPSEKPVDIQPVWVFEGFSIVDGKKHTFDAFVPAEEGVKIVDVPNFSLL